MKQTQSNIMIEYAKLIDNNSIIKSAGKLDLVQTIGQEAAVSLPLAGAGAAGLLGAGGAGGSAGVLAALGLTGPVGWVLTSGLLAYAIYAAMKNTNDTIEDLLEKLDALDPNPPAETLVGEKGVFGNEGGEWKETLESFKPHFQIKMIPEDANERMKFNVQQIKNLTSVSAYLARMIQQWPQVKSNLSDDGIDPAQFENSLNKTFASVNKQLAGIRATAQQESRKMLSEVSQRSGVDYKSLANELLEKYNSVMQITGDPPVPDSNDEVQALWLAKLILDDNATQEQIMKYGPYMKKSLDGLNKLLTHRKKSDCMYLSKRAWRLSTDSIRDTSNVVKRAPANLKVKDLQSYVNFINDQLLTGAVKISEDGIYGEKTGAALQSLMNSNKSILSTFNKYGISADMVVQPSVMNDDNINKATKILEVIADYVSKQTGKSVDKDDGKVDQKKEVSVSRILNDMERRRDLSDEELLYYIENKVMTNPHTNRRATIMDHIRTNTRNMPGLTPDSMKGIPGSSSAVKLIKQVFFDGGQTAPLEWGDMLPLFSTLKGGKYGPLF